MLRTRIDYTPREIWRPFHASTARFRVVVAHRRAGKTVAFLHELQRAAIRCDKPAPRLAYIAPYLGQAKAIAWDCLKGFASEIPGTRFSESELRVDYPGGASVSLPARRWTRTPMPANTNAASMRAWAGPITRASFVAPRPSAA